MSINKEVLGLRIEIAGLIAILVATLWQGSFTDWFDRNDRNWIAYTQETANLAMLIALRDLSAQVATSDSQRQREIHERVSEQLAKTVSEAISERTKREGLQRGQASTFATVRYALLLLGAAFVVVGKWLVLHHKSVTSGSSAKKPSTGAA
jgi:hypothetical protein